VLVMQMDGYHSRIVVLFDNSFFDFLYKNGIDLEVIERMDETFDLEIKDLDLKIITTEVYKKAKERKYEFPYSEIIDRFYHNWENLKYAIYKDLKIFEEEYYRVKNFLERAFGCFNIRIAKEELDLFTSTLLLKFANLNPVVISDDGRFLFFSSLISSYYGFCLRFFSTFELLCYMDRLKYREELEKCNSHFEVQMNLTPLDEIDDIKNCSIFIDDILCGLKKSFLTVHPSIKSSKHFRLIIPK